MGRAGRRFGLTVGLVIGLAGMIMSAWAELGGNFWLFSWGPVWRELREARLTFLAMPRPRSAPSTAGQGDRLDRFRRNHRRGGGAAAGVSRRELCRGRLALSREWPVLAGAIVLALSAVFTFVLLRPDPLTISRQMDDHDRFVAGCQEDGASRPLGTIVAELARSPGHWRDDDYRW